MVKKHEPGYGFYPNMLTDGTARYARRTPCEREACTQAGGKGTFARLVRKQASKGRRVGVVFPCHPCTIRY